MANKTGAELIATVRARSARTNDNVLITVTFVLDALNEGQVHIVKKCPRLVDMDKPSTTDYQLSTDDTSIDITTLNPAHIGGIWILNGASTRREGLKYRTLEEYRAKYLPVAEQSSGEPIAYTRQGNTIHFNCPVASDYNNLYLQIDYTSWATDLLNGAVASELNNSNKGLIFYALAEVYDELAMAQPQFEQKALKTRVLFNQWLDEYTDYNEMLFEELYDE